jgi:pyruvate dehydrogenase E1 component
LGEGLQHQDGHSLLMASTVPVCRSYDPAFAYETAVIVRNGIERMYPPNPADGEDIFYYLTVYNENYAMPAMPEGIEQGIIDGLYRWQAAPEGEGPEVTILFSGTGCRAAEEARNILASQHGVRASLWSATSFQMLRFEALEAQRSNLWNPDAPQREPLVTQKLRGSAGPVVAVTDFMRAVPDQISRFIPDGRPYTSLGTDGFGRSDTREALRDFFETDANHVVAAVLSELATAGAVDRTYVVNALKELETNGDLPAPWTR